MPYRRKGRVIYHKRGSSWRKKQRCRSVVNAKRAMRLLRGIAHGMKVRGR